MFLFTKNLAEDFEFMCKGVEEGVITKERLDEAVVRVLALKAALDLNKPRTLPTLESALRCWARRAQAVGQRVRRYGRHPGEGGARRAAADS